MNAQKDVKMVARKVSMTAVKWDSYWDNLLVDLMVLNLVEKKADY